MLQRWWRHAVKECFGWRLVRLPHFHLLSAEKCFQVNYKIEKGLFFKNPLPTIYSEKQRGALSYTVENQPSRPPNILVLGAKQAAIRVFFFFYEKTRKQTKSSIEQHNQHTEDVEIHQIMNQENKNKTSPWKMNKGHPPNAPLLLRKLTLSPEKFIHFNSSAGICQNSNKKNGTLQLLVYGSK